MRIVVLYHPNSEGAGLAEDFKHNFEHHYQNRKVELLSLDTREGWAMASLYDVVRYPAILILSNNGQLQKMYQDQPWPVLEEVASLAPAEESMLWSTHTA